MTFGRKCWCTWAILNVCVQSGSTGYIICDIESTKSDILLGAAATFSAVLFLIYNWYRSIPKPLTIKFREIPILKTPKDEIPDAEFEDVK